MHWSRRRIVRTGLTLLSVGAAAATGLAATAVSAAPGPCPGACVVGQLSGGAGAGTSQSVTGVAGAVSFTITDESSGPLGSADLTPPSGFVIDASTFTPIAADNPQGDGPWAAQVSGNVLQLRDLDLGPGGHFTVQIPVLASCSASSSSPWTLVSEPGDSFVQGGGTLATDASSSLAVTVEGECSLAFTAEPTNAVAGAGITSSGFDPAGSPVAVEATDANGSPIPAIAVGLSAELGSGTLQGSGAAAATGGSGVATFSPISVDQTGYYRLEAAATSFAPAASSLFQIADSATTCGTGCSGTDVSPSVSLDVSVRGGSGDVLSLGLGGFSYSCPGYRTVTTPGGIDLWQPGGVSIVRTRVDETVTITISKALVMSAPNPGAAHFQVCYASTEPFSGGVDVGPAIPGYPATYVGLLGGCARHDPAAGAPCVVSRHKTRAGQEVITFLGAPGDFWGSA